MKEHWCTDDFPELSWHDVHVHGWRLESFNEDEGAADLVLDIDYIVAWPDLATSSIFLLAPANLRFMRVFGLKAEIDFLSPSAGMTPMSIHGITRELLSYPTGFQTFRWDILLNWPRGSFVFEAPAFEQTLTQPPRAKDGLWLTTGERTVSVAA